MPTGEKQFYHFDKLLSEINLMIETAKMSVAMTVNTTTSVLYWNVGKRINQEILNNKRAEYGKLVLSTLSNQLTIQYGKGWSEKQLYHCQHFANTFPDQEILYTLCRELSWSHLRMLMFIKDTLKRDFYIEMCKLENWSVRMLNEKIGTMLFERTAIAKRPDETIRKEIAELRENDKLTPDMVFRDPYFLNFLGLTDRYSEKNLEEAILGEIESFILELGQGFSFIERQKKMLIDDELFRLDLLFFHRKLKRLIAVEIKLDKFKAAYKGQMELYLRYLEKYEMEAGEEPPMGLILCAEGSYEQIELLQLGQSGIRVAQYLTELPSKRALMEKLHTIIEREKTRLCLNLDNEL